MKRKILVAENDKSLGTWICKILQNEGYEVFVKENGQLVWETLQKESIDLAIFDTDMSEMNGLQLSKKVRADERYKSLPVLFLTGEAIVDDQVKNYTTDIDGYITKPFDRDDLRKRVDESIQKLKKSPRGIRTPHHKKWGVGIPPEVIMTGSGENIDIKHFLKVKWRTLKSLIKCLFWIHETTVIDMNTGEIVERIKHGK